MYFVNLYFMLVFLILFVSGYYFGLAKIWIMVAGSLRAPTHDDPWIIKFFLKLGEFIFLVFSFVFAIIFGIVVPFFIIGKILGY